MDISRTGQLTAKEVQKLLNSKSVGIGGRAGGGVEAREDCVKMLMSEYPSSSPPSIRITKTDRTSCTKSNLFHSLPLKPSKTDIFDTDRSGSINFSEFEGLYRYIQEWHGIFRKMDRDNSGTIDRRELGEALHSFGFMLPGDLVRKLEKRFSE